MAQYTERLWTQTKDTEQLTFVAGVDLPYRELVKESGPNTNIMVVATTVDAIGYVLSPKGVLAGEKVDVQMLYGSPGGGGGGAVNSVTGLAPNVIVDNTDPTNPIVAAGTESWEFSGILTTPVLSNIQNNYTQAGMVDISTLRVVCDPFDPPFFTGLSGGTDGRFLIVHNTSTDVAMYFLHDSPSSIAANRILIPGFTVADQPMIVPINHMIIFQYDNISQRWRMIHKGVQTVTGLNTDNTDPLNPIINISVDGVTITGTGTPGDPLVAVGGGATASLLEDAAPQLNQWQWDNGAGQLGTLILDSKFENAIHVAKNGNDALALQTLYQPFSTKVPFLTINAAYAASNSSHTIVVWPGKYILTATIDVDFTQAWRIHCMPGVSVQNAVGIALNFTGTGTFDWTGHAIFQIHTYFFNSSAGDLVRLNLEGDYAFNDNLLGNQYFANLQSMYVDIRLNELRNLGFFAPKWRAGFIGIDLWTCTSQNLLYCDSPDPTYLSSYGPARLVMGGRTTPKGRIEKSQASITNAGIYFVPIAYNYWDLTLELNFDVDWIDGYFILHGNGHIILNGNVFPTKSNELGNELPWYVSNTPFESSDDIEKPCFRHNGNSVNRKFKPDDETSWFLNNTAYFIQAAGKYYLNGFYQGLGASDNGVAGDFPVVAITDDSSGSNVNIYLNGVFKSAAPARASIITGSEVGPIKINTSGFSKIKVYFMNVIAICLNDEKTEPPIWNSALSTPVPIFVNHSLVLSGNINTIDYPNGYSFDHVVVDTAVDYLIEEYSK